MKYFKHLRNILLHKWYVCIECWKRGLFLQGIVHDLSKLSPTEFFTSARYFQERGKGSPVEAEKKDKGYSKAWFNHKAKNKHHWMYWTDRKDGVWYAVPMPKKYVTEMLCDFIGAGKIYSKEKWTPQEPLNFYRNIEGKRMFLHPETRELFEDMLEKLSDSK